MEALVSGHHGDAKKVPVTGAGRLRECFSKAVTRGVRDRWPLTGACPANNKHWECRDVYEDKNKHWNMAQYKNHCHKQRCKIQEDKGISFRVSAYGSSKNLNPWKCLRPPLRECMCKYRVCMGEKMGFEKAVVSSCQLTRVAVRRASTVRSTLALRTPRY